MKIWTRLLLATLLVVGCRQEQPGRSGKQDEPVLKPESRLEPAPPVKRKPTADEIKKRLVAEYVDVYLVLPRKDEFAAIVILDKVIAGFKESLDELPPLKLDTTGGGWFLKVSAAPVKDVEAFAKKQNLGRVLAFDPAKRRLLIDYTAAALPRETWKDAAFLDQQVLARSAPWGLQPLPGFAADQIVYVRLRGDWSKTAFATQQKLRTLLDGPKEKRLVWTVDREHTLQDWATAMAPVKDLEALVKKIDFAEVVFFDTDHKALICNAPLKLDHQNRFLMAYREDSVAARHAGGFIALCHSGMEGRHRVARFRRGP